MEPAIEFYESKNNYFTDVAPVVDPSKFSFEHNFQEEIKHFIDCVENGTPCLNPGEDGVELMKILDAIYESSKTGHEVIIK